MARAPRVVPQKSDGVQRRSYMNAYRKTEHMGQKILGTHRQNDVSAPKDTRSYGKRGKGLRADKNGDFNVDFGETGFIDRNFKEPKR
jgi:hypothetical protein